MGTGLFRDSGFVHVSYEGRVAVPISVGLYRQRGYQPPLNQLPTKAEYEANAGTSR